MPYENVLAKTRGPHLGGFTLEPYQWPPALSEKNAEPPKKPAAQNPWRCRHMAMAQKKSPTPKWDPTTAARLDPTYIHPG